MSAVAYIGQRDILRRTIDLYVGHEYEGCYTSVAADGSRTTLNPEDQTPSEPTITLLEAEARALLSALLRHFEGGDDMRALRKDYDAERGRVDKLTDAVIHFAKAAA